MASRPRSFSYWVGVTTALFGTTYATCTSKHRQFEREREFGCYARVPVIVAADAVSQGTILTYDMISQRAVPEQFVTMSVIKPDSASHVVGQRIQVPLQPGDMIRWSDIEARPTP